MNAKIVSFQAKPEVSAAEKFETLKALHGLGALVTAQEFQILHFIWMRTIFWGKARAYVSVRHILEGVFDRATGECVAPPINICERHARRLLGELIEQGMLIREMQNGSGGYPYYRINFEKGFQMLCEPKKKKEKQGKGLAQPKQVDPPATHSSPPCYPKQATKYEKRDYEKKKCAATPRDISAVNQLKENMNVIKENNKTRRKEKVKRGGGKTNEALEIIWQDAARATFPEMPLAAKWSSKEHGQVSAFKKSLAEEKIEAGAFLTFAAESWARVGALYFRKGKVEFPKYPDMGFLMTFKKSFIAAFADTRFNERQLKITRDERQLQKYIRMGYTQAQAEKMIADNVKEAAAIQKATEKASKAEMDARALAAKNAQLEKENRELQIQRGKELQQQERMNRGSNKVKPKPKLDKEGFAVFEPEEAPEWSDSE